MRKPLRVALVGAGKSAESPLSGTHNLATYLGPVKAPSLRVASRLVNTLRAGHAVADYEEFKAVSMVLVSVPDEMARDIIDELKQAEVPWKGKSVVLCSNELGSAELEPLAQLGASTGSLGLTPGFNHRWFLIEAEKKLQRLLRPLVTDTGVRITAIEPGQKPHYLAGLDAVGPQFIPLLRASAESLRAAGVSSSDAETMIDRQVSRTVRSYFRSGKVG